MSVVSVRPRDFILALFIRDDGERFLLGDNGYDFKDSQLHFSGNSIENDEVQKQGADGVMIAGQVRRASVQSFDGFVGDATDLKETIEEMRRDFIAFFAKGHHFRVIYVDTSRNAWQRKGGYLVDAPEVKELYQMHPEYHVGLNFEDVNYYSYDEDADGNEILANLVDIPVSTEASGGLVWDEDGAVSDDATVTYDTATAVATPAKNVNITDAAVAPLASFRLDGETSQNGTPTPDAPVPVQTTTGENVVKITGKNLLPNRMTSGTIAGAVQNTVNSDGSFTLNGTATSGANVDYNREDGYYVHLEQGKTYTLSVNNAGVYWRLRKVSENTNIATIDSPSTRLTFTANATEDALLYFVILNNSSFSSTNYKVQLELGSATAYEPYQGQSYEVNLGKNLFDKNANTGAFRAGKSIVEEEITITSTSAGNGYVAFVIPNSNDLLGKTCSISIEDTTVSVPGAKGSFAIYQAQEASPATVGGFVTNAEVIGQNYSKTFTFPASFSGSSNCFAILLYPNNSGGGTTVGDNAKYSNIQLELGSQATSYAAYFAPIELCKIGTYQDYIYKSGDKWYKHKAIGKYTFSDMSQFTYTSDKTRLYITKANLTTLGVDFVLPANQQTSLLAFSDRFSATSFDTLYNSESGSFLASSNTGNWSFRKVGWSGADGAKAELTGTTVYYALATPTDTEITNEALIDQLNALLTTARTFAGINNITTITPNEQGTLEISYYTKYQPRVTAGGYVWEAGGSGGATTVVNNSIGNVNPIWKVYGPTNNPTLENTTTGEQIEYIGLVADGQTLTIDMGAQTASLDGLNVISNVVGDYISLAPGANKLVYSVTGEAGASELGWSEIVG